MVDIDAARRFLAAEFESAGLPHAAGSILAGISPYGKGAYIAAVAAALAARQSVGEPVCGTCRGEICPDAPTGTTCDCALRYVAERPTGYAECPVTGLPFYGNMEHPKRGLIAMYGGPLDVYSAPELQDNDGELRCERYDLDADCWVEGGEPLGYFYQEQQPDDSRQPVGQELFGWWLQDDNGVGYFSRTMQPAALYAHRTTPGYSATPLYAPRTAA